MSSYHITHLLSQHQFNDFFKNEATLQEYFLSSELSESLLCGNNRQQFLRGRWAAKCGVMALLQPLSISYRALDIQIKSTKRGASIFLKNPIPTRSNHSPSIFLSISHEHHYSVACIAIQIQSCHDQKS